jgi:hypothetical protein
LDKHMQHLSAANNIVSYQTHPDSRMGAHEEAFSANEANNIVNYKPLGGGMQHYMEQLDMVAQQAQSESVYVRI